MSPLKMCRVCDSIYAKKHGLILTFDGTDEDNLSPKVGQAVTLISPKDLFITTIILGVERFMRAIEYPNDPFGILVQGFEPRFDMIGWTCIFHPLV